GAIVDFSNTVGLNDDGKVGAGSIEGSGTFFLGSNQLTVGGNNLSTAVSGIIADGGSGGGAGGSLVKIGNGTLTLNGINTYTGITDVQAGTLLVGDQSNPGASIAAAAQIDSGATLGGYGTIGGDLTNFGTVRPGVSIGTLIVHGNYTQAAGSTLAVE